MRKRPLTRASFLSAVRFGPEKRRTFPPDSQAFPAGVPVNGATLNPSPSLENILMRVSSLGAVLPDSILATDDWGMPHISARSLWLRPRSFRRLIMAAMIADFVSASSRRAFASGSAALTVSLYSFQVMSDPSFVISPLLRAFFPFRSGLPHVRRFGTFCTSDHMIALTLSCVNGTRYAPTKYGLPSLPIMIVRMGQPVLSVDQ